MLSSEGFKTQTGFGIKLDDNIDLMTHSIKSPKDAMSVSRKNSLLDLIV